MNIKVCSPRDMFNPSNRDHYWIDKNSPLMKLTIRDLSYSDITYIDSFVKRFSSKEAWNKYVEEIQKTNTSRESFDKINNSLKKFEKLKPILNEVLKIPSNSTLFGTDRSALSRLENFLKKFSNRDIYKAMMLMQPAKEILAKADRLRSEALIEKRKADAVLRLNGWNAQRNHEILMKKAEAKSREADEIERTIHTSISGINLLKNPNLIMDVGWRYQNWKKSASSMQKILDDAIDHNERMISKYKKFLLHFRKMSISRFNNIYGEKSLADVVEIERRILCYQEQINKMAKDHRNIQGQMERKMNVMISEFNRKGSIRANFDRGKVTGFDKQGYDSFILAAYKKFFRPGAVLKFNRDGTSSFINFRSPEDALGKIRLSFHHLEEIKEHGEFLDNVEHRYNDVMDYRDMPNIRKTIHGGHVSNVSKSLAEYRTARNGSDEQNRFNYIRQNSYSTYRVNYEEKLDRMAEADYHRREIYDPVDGWKVDYDVRAKYDPRWRPTNPLFFSFGRRGNMDESNVADSIENRFKKIDRRDPIKGGRIVSNRYGQRGWLDENILRQRREQYILQQMYRTDTLGHPSIPSQGTLIRNIKGPWQYYREIQQQIANMTHADQVAPVGAKIYNIFHPEGISATDRIIQDPKHGGYSYEMLDLIKQLKVKAFLLDDPSLRDVEHEEHLDHFSDEGWLSHVIRERKINGWIAFKRANNEFERVGSVVAKRDVESTDPYISFQNDERYAMRGTGNRKIRIERGGDYFSEHYPEVHAANDNDLRLLRNVSRRRMKPLSDD